MAPFTASTAKALQFSSGAKHVAITAPVVMEGGHTDRGEEQSGEHVASEAYNAYQLLKHCTEANASRSGVACQFPQFAGDFPRNQRFAHCNGHPTEIEKRGAG